MLKRGGMIRSPRWACGSGRAWMTIKMAGLGRKTRSIEEQMAKLKEKVREKNISSSAWKRAACGGLGAGRGAVTVHLNVEVYSGRVAACSQPLLYAGPRAVAHLLAVSRY